MRYWNRTDDGSRSHDRQIGAKPSARSFIGFAGEEFHLLGALLWVKAHKDKLPKIANLFNRDGGPNLLSVSPSLQAMYDDFVKISEPIQKSVGLSFRGKKFVNPVNARHAWGNRRISFRHRRCPYIRFHHRGFQKDMIFDYGEIWHTERDLYTKNIPRIPRTYGYCYRYHSPRCSESG